ncbi:cupin domain-containing protein [Arenicella xantha]|uniref:Cupin domain n=1 Tax=Arenicella xantha TaxID=644221 RepID=A0A395JW40_9GAMM|nr:cupin domain-containing protein [Arenicella xantha]RBP53768.1 cupin domain [Arenicella xantha]
MSTDEYYFKEGCFIQEWHNAPDDETVSVAHVRVEPRQTTKLHALTATTERYIMLQGRGQVTVGSKSWLVEAGDVVVIPPDQAQAIENLEDQDLVFLAVCTPRFDIENYQELQP